MAPVSRASLPAVYGPAIRVVRAGFHFTRPDRFRLVIMVLLSLVSGGLEALLLGLFAIMILAMMGTHLEALTPSFRGMPAFFLPLLSAGAIACLIAIAFPLSRLSAALSTDALIRLRRMLLRAYSNSSLAYRDSYRENYLAQLAGENCIRSEMLVQYMVTALNAAAILLVLVLYAVVIAPVTALALMAGLALFALLLAPLLRKIRRDRQASVTLTREMIMQVGEMARLSESIAAFHVGNRVSAVLGDTARAAARLVNGLRFENRLLPSLYQYGGLVVVLVIILMRHFAQGWEFSGLAPLAFLLLRALGYVKAMSSAVQNGIEQVPFAEILLDELAALEDHPAQSGTLVPAHFSGLRFEGVGYAYRSTPPVLGDVSFEIRLRRGQKHPCQPDAAASDRHRGPHHGRRCRPE